MLRLAAGLRPLMFLSLLLAGLPGLTAAQTAPAAPTPLPVPRSWSAGGGVLGCLNFSEQNTPRTMDNGLILGPAVEATVAYTTARGWRLTLAGAHGLLAGVALDAAAELGQGSKTTLAGQRVAGRVGRVWPMGARGRWLLLPQLGLTYARLSRKQSGLSVQPLIYADPSAGTVTRRLVVTDTPGAASYEAGAGVAHRFGAAGELEVGLTFRMAGTFGTPTVAIERWEYDRRGVAQPALETRSRLESAQLSLSATHWFGAR